MELDPIIKKALLEIDFFKRYEMLSEKYSKQRLMDKKSNFIVDKKDVLSMFESFGYPARYYGGEKFYKLKYEIIDDITFGIHISLNNNSVEFIWIVINGDKNLLGDPWGIFSRLVIDPDYIIPMPRFGSYDDLKEIFDYGFTMYNDFKNALIRSIKNNGL